MRLYKFAKLNLQENKTGFILLESNHVLRELKVCVNCVSSPYVSSSFPFSAAGK